MERHQTIVLSTLIGLLVIVLGLLTWSLVYEGQQTFLGGTEAVHVEDGADIKPTAPLIRTTDPALGSSDPKALTIVEFSDFTCLYCRLTQPELLRALKNSSVPTRLIWRDLPISALHPEGLTAALAGRCAHDQGKFWIMHDGLFNAKALDDPTILALAQRAGLDMPTFQSCLSKGTHLAEIRADITSAQQHGITKSPTFFVGNKSISGFVSSGELRRFIDDAIKTR